MGSGIVQSAMASLKNVGKQLPETNVGIANIARKVA